MFSFDDHQVSTDLSPSIHSSLSMITKPPPQKPTSLSLDDQERRKTTTMRCFQQQDQSSTVSTELSLNILGPATSNSIKQQQQKPFFLDVERKLFQFKHALTRFQEGDDDESSVSTELSLNIHHRPLIVPSNTKPQTFLLDRNLPFKKRSIPKVDSVHKTAKRKFVKEENQKQELKREKKKRKTSKKKEDRPVVVNEVTERLQKFVKNKMNGSDLKLLIQKSLTASDLSHGQNRLNMPALQLETNDFLTADERNIVKEKKSVIEIGMLGPNLRMYDKKIELKIWDMQCSQNYVLKNNWYNFVKQHDRILKEGSLYQVWSFRMNGQLCLAIVCPDHVEQVHDGENELVVVGEV